MTYGVEVKIPTPIVKSLGLLDQTGSATPISVGAGNRGSVSRIFMPRVDGTVPPGGRRRPKPEFRTLGAKSQVDVYKARIALV